MFFFVEFVSNMKSSPFESFPKRTKAKNILLDIASFCYFKFAFYTQHFYITLYWIYLISKTIQKSLSGPRMKKKICNILRTQNVCVHLNLKSFIFTYLPNRFKVNMILSELLLLIKNKIKGKKSSIIMCLHACFVLFSIYKSCTRKQTQSSCHMWSWYIEYRLSVVSMNEHLRWALMIANKLTKQFVLYWNYHIFVCT